MGFRVQDDTDEVPRLGEMVAEPDEVLEVILADARSGFHFNACQIAVAVFDLCCGPSAKTMFVLQGNSILTYNYK